MYSDKVKAFTIMEVMITMMISAILLAMIYLIYMVISGSYSVFKIKNEELNTIGRLDELLKKDFRNGRFIRGNQNMISISGEGDSVIYQMEKAYIVRRKAGVVDTFKVTTADKSLNFERSLSENMNNTSNVVDELTLSVIYKQDTLHYHYQADYSSSDLLTQDKHAID